MAAPAPGQAGQEEAPPRVELGRFFITIDQLAPMLKEFYYTSLMTGLLTPDERRMLHEEMTWRRRAITIEDVLRYVKPRAHEAIRHWKTLGVEEADPVLYGARAELYIRELEGRGYMPPIPVAISGPPGIGKSLERGTPILIVRDGKPLIAPIEEVRKGDYVVAITKNLDMRLSRVKAVHEMWHSGKLVVVKTRSGRTIRATPDHSFVVLTNGVLEVKAGRELRKGDILPTFRGQLPALIKEIRLPPPGANAKYRRAEPITLNFDFGFLVGIYLAEGYAAPNCIRITNGDPMIKETVKKIVEKLGFSAKIGKRDVIIYGNQLGKWLKSAFGSGAGSKRIAPFCFFAPEEFRIGLLSGYFSGDGSFHKARGGKGIEETVIMWYTKSRELRDGIALLLASLGIGSTVGTKTIRSGKYAGRTYYRGYVFDKREFLTKIPIRRSGFNTEEYMRCQEHSPFEKIVIPRGVLASLARKLGLWKVGRKKWFKHYWDKVFRRRCLTREGLKNLLAAITSELPFNGAALEELEVLRKIAESTVIYDEVVEVREEPYEGPVYDIETEENTFMVANGVFVHNSQITRMVAEEIARELGLAFRASIHDAMRVTTTEGGEEKGIFIFLDIRASQLEPPDILGLYGYDEETGRTIYFPPIWLPRCLFGIIFLDELNLASYETLSALYQLILDRRIPASGYVVPPFIAIVSAFNRPGYDVQIGEAKELPEPLSNRMAHFILHITDTRMNSPANKLYETWLSWAEKTNEKTGLPNVHPLITYYIRKSWEWQLRTSEWKCGEPYKFVIPPLMNYDATEYATSKAGGWFAYATPRSWHRLSEYLYTKIPFSEWKRIKPKLDEIEESMKEALQEKNPEKVAALLEATEKIVPEETVDEIHRVAKTLIGVKEADEFAVFLRMFQYRPSGAEMVEHYKTFLKALKKAERRG